MTENQGNSNQTPPTPPPTPPPTEVSATPWVDPFVYVEVRGSQGDGNRKEQRDIRTK